MEIRTMQISRISRADYNPRVELKPGDPVYEKLKSSIQTFGFCEPLIFNSRTGHLIGGHQRLTVLKDLGYTEAEVVVVDLPLEQEKALNITLNKVQGDWDEQKLAVLLDELTETPEFDVGLTGFETEEISDILDRALDIESCQVRDESFDVEEALDRENPAVTQPGDLIELGNHRLLCGDASKPSSLRKLLGDQKVQLLFTDPSYNVDCSNGNRPQPDRAKSKRLRQWQKIRSDNLTQDQYTKWLGRVLRNVSTILAAGAAVYIWNGHKQFGPMHRLLGSVGIKVSCVITWAKESFALGYGDYNQQTEFCLYGWLENNGAHKWYGPNSESTLWQVHRGPTREYMHPTQKPLELAERAMRNSSLRGETVLDTFLGSGTTLIAAERLSRRCFGIEIDPHYCDVIVRRWIAFVGVDDTPGNLVDRYCVDASSEVPA